MKFSCYFGYSEWVALVDITGCKSEGDLIALAAEKGDYIALERCGHDAPYSPTSAYFSVRRSGIQGIDPARVLAVLTLLGTAAGLLKP